MTVAAADTRALARTLLARALATFRRVPAPFRDEALAAIDHFVVAPGPARFLGATRALATAQRRHLLDTAGAASLRRGLDEGLAAVRAAPGVPAAVADRLADLPPDPRAAQRLQALATLIGAYDQLLGRVLEDTEAMRRRLGKHARKRPQRRPRGR